MPFSSYFSTELLPLYLGLRITEYRNIDKCLAVGGNCKDIQHVNRFQSDRQGKMKFDCKEISISDEAFGCTLTISENGNNNVSEIGITIDEILASSGHYILLQRTYPEDEFESDYYYIETSNPDKSGELKDFSINLYRTQLLMTYDNEIIEIGINTSDEEFEILKKILRKLTEKKGQLIVHD